MYLTIGEQLLGLGSDRLRWQKERSRGRWASRCPRRRGPTAASPWRNDLRKTEEEQSLRCREGLPRWCRRCKPPGWPACRASPRSWGSWVTGPSWGPWGWRAPCSGFRPRSRRRRWRKRILAILEDKFLPSLQRWKGRSHLRLNKTNFQK